MAVIKVGGATETAMKERKALYEDSLHATRAALAEGIVPGGGVALLSARRVLEKPMKGEGDEAYGYRVLLRCAGHADASDRRERRRGRHGGRQQHRASRRTRTTGTTPTPTSTPTCARTASSIR